MSRRVATVFVLLFLAALLAAPALALGGCSAAPLGELARRPRRDPPPDMAAPAPAPRHRPRPGDARVQLEVPLTP